MIPAVSTGMTHIQLQAWDRGFLIFRRRVELSRSGWEWAMSYLPTGPNCGRHGRFGTVRISMAASTVVVDVF